MEYPIRKLAPNEFPPLLHEIPDAPKTLFVCGSLPPLENKLLAVVGSRKYSNYGKEAVGHLIGGLRGQPITVVSGLAIGIDGLAHAAALEAGLHTVAVPGSGLESSILYPRQNRTLAMHILESGGGLLSEFEPNEEATTWSFPRRNRIMAGMSHATLVVEARERSGTLITSRLATEYNRDVLAVPGSIFSENAAGPHMLISLGATPVRHSRDILEVLGIQKDDPAEASLPPDLSPLEQKILELLHQPLERDTLIRSLNVPAHETNVALSGMELKGFIKDYGGLLSRT